MRHLHTKRWYFCPACCTVCNNLTLLSLFSLSQSVWHRFPIFSPSIVTCLLFSALPTWWRITPFFSLLFRFVCFDFPPPLLFLLSICPPPFLLYYLFLSQCDGLSGWFLRCSWSLCKYACLSSTASLVTYLSPPPCCLVGFQVWNGMDQTRRDVYFWVFWLITAWHFTET